MTDGSGGGVPPATTGRLARIAVFPVKSLDPEVVPRATVGDRGALVPDRTFAIFDGDGRYVNGKREPAVHRLRSEFDPGGDSGDPTLSLRPEGGEEWVRFDPDADRSALEGWLSDHLGYPVEVRRDRDGGYPDDREAHGPTLVSTATLETVAGWFPSLSVESVRRRFRANLEVEGVPAFWEDRLFGAEGESVPFRVGGTTLHGVNPCQRCVVPTRDPRTGEPTEGFRETFVERREATLPDWAERSRFDHFYRLMVNTRVPKESRGRAVRVGDEVRVVDGA